MLVRFFVIALLSLVIVSCNSGHDKTGAQNKPGRRELVELNRYMVAKDRERIENYIARKDLKMTETQSGLWYMIKSEGKGNYFTDNDRVTMEYDCITLDGTYCYSSKESGPKEIIVGRTKIESGLDQGLRLLKPGGEAIFIIPPFIGWGFPGDGGKIPSRAVLVYNIKVIDKK
jgi:FKBP-type peptidyl-prolyl cis-trans isomerase FkpA